MSVREEPTFNAFMLSVSLTSLEVKHPKQCGKAGLDDTHPACLTMLVHTKQVSNVNVRVSAKPKEFPNSFYKKRKPTVSRIFSISLDLMSYDFFIIGPKQFLSEATQTECIPFFI